MAAIITAVPSKARAAAYSGRLRPPVQGRPPLPVRQPIVQGRTAQQLPKPRQTSQPSQLRPTILSVDHIKRAIGDDNFYTMLPEFLAVKRKMEAMNVDYSRRCSDCTKRRIATSLTSDFVSVLTGLSDDGLARVKKYLGVPRLMVRAKNTQTGKVELREI